MKLSHNIFIMSSVDEVWKHTVTPSKWSKWNPNIQDISYSEDGELTVGDTFQLKQVGMAKAEWKVLDIQEKKSCRWMTTSPGIKIIAQHSIEAKDKGVSNILTLEVTGIMSFLLYPIILLSSKSALKKENEGLRNYIVGSNGKD